MIFRLFLTFSLLGIFLYNSIGSILVYEFKKKQAREQVELQIERKMSTTQLEKITFTVAASKSIHWERKEKEFEYKGKMYDVAYKKLTKHYITFFCIDDKKEHQLKKDFYKLAKNHGNNKKGDRSYLKKIFSNYYLLSKKPIIQEINSKDLANLNPRKKQYFSILLGYLQLNTPPPKNA